MFTFLFMAKPRSVQAKTSLEYKKHVLSACRRYNAKPPMLKEPLYGIVYYFYRGRLDVDADNMSKPIWDSLEGHMYADDRVIELRKAGVRSLERGISLIDLTEMPDRIARDFLFYADDQEHLVYVEVGRLSPKMFTFASEIRYGV
jgi:Holliday junction resolvase RusA-like endonuclease